MSFRRMLSNNEPKEVTLLLGIIFIFLIAISILMEDSGFTDSSMDTPTHFYNTPRPDPSREIDYFDHSTQTFKYKDERRVEPARQHEPRTIYRRTKQQRLMDDWVDALKDDIMDEVEMDIDD